MGEPALRVIPHSQNAGKVAAATSRRDLLVALRDEIASRIDEGVPARDLAALSLRLMAIAKELEEFEAVDGDRIARAVAVPDRPFTPS